MADSAPTFGGIREPLQAHPTKSELLSQPVRFFQDLYKESRLPTYLVTLLPFAALKLHVSPFSEERPSWVSPPSLSSLLWPLYDTPVSQSPTWVTFSTELFLLSL